MPKYRIRNPIKALSESQAVASKKTTYRMQALNISDLAAIKATQQLLSDQTFLSKHPKTHKILREAYLTAIIKLAPPQELDRWDRDPENVKLVAKNPKLGAELASIKEYINKNAKNSQPPLSPPKPETSTPKSSSAVSIADTASATLIKKALETAGNNVEKGNLDSAIIILNNTIAQVNKTTNVAPELKSEIAKLHCSLGLIKNQRSEFNNALEHFKTALTLFREVPPEQRPQTVIGMICNEMINVHYQQGIKAHEANNSQLALQHFDNALKILKNLSIPSQSDLKMGTHILTMLQTDLKTAPLQQQKQIRSLIMGQLEAKHLKDQQSIEQLFHNNNKTTSANYINANLNAMLEVGAQHVNRSNIPQAKDSFLAVGHLYKDANATLQKYPNLLQGFNSIYQDLKSAIKILQIESKKVAELDTLTQTRPTTSNAYSTTARIAMNLAGNGNKAQTILATPHAKPMDAQPAPMPVKKSEPVPQVNLAPEVESPRPKKP